MKIICSRGSYCKSRIFRMHAIFVYFVCGGFRTKIKFFPFLPKLHFQFPSPPFLSSFFPFLFLSLPLPLPSTFRLRFKISLFAFIPLITILSGRARCTMATVTGSPSEAGLVCGHWIMPMLWSGGRTDKISNKLAGDVACLGGLMVEHQPRLLGSRVWFPAGAFAIFFRFCQSFTSNSPPPPLSFPLSFPSSSFPFLFLSLRPFVCALKSHSSHLSL